MLDAHIEIETDDGGLDAFVACPDGLAPRAPVLLLADRRGLRPAIETLGRRLAAHGYFVLAPNWTARPADERRDDAEAWFDHLANERRVHDARVGILGYGAGADLALRVAAWRAERVAAVAAFMGGGFAAVPALEIAQRINALVHLGYENGRMPGPKAATLEAALCAAGVDFEAEGCACAPGREPWDGEAHLRRLLDLFERTLGAARVAGGDVAALSPRP